MSPGEPARGRESLPKRVRRQVTGSVCRRLPRRVSINVFHPARILVGRESSKRSVQNYWIVRSVNVQLDWADSFLFCAQIRSLFGFEYRKEALHHYSISAISLTTHADLHAERTERLTKVIVDVLTAESGYRTLSIVRRRRSVARSRSALVSLPAETAPCRPSAPDTCESSGLTFAPRPMPIFRRRHQHRPSLDFLCPAQVGAAPIHYRNRQLKLRTKGPIRYPGARFESSPPDADLFGSP